MPARADIRECENIKDLTRVLSDTIPAVVVSGSLGNQTWDAINAAHLVRETHPETKVVFIADSSSEEVAIGALRAGVAEYLKGPVDALEIAEAITRVLPSLREPGDDFEELVGSSPEIRDIKLLIGRIAPLTGSVLITGESGSGKEVVARLIHSHSVRAKSPFVCVNCAAVPDSLFESELFGHEKGAFTGAVCRQAGQMRLADGGTLFLDEIGDMTALAQSKMLRALEQREVQPLGAARPIPVDIRLITATNRDLETLVAAGKFRADLFYRLDVTRIHLPPLRERRSDIPALAMHFIREMNKKYGRPIEGLTPAALTRLTDHDWPGNIRQLRNTIESAAVICESSRISDSDLRTFRSRATSASLTVKTVSAAAPPTKPVQPRKDALLEALEATHWNMTRTAELLKWSRSTVYRQLSKYQIERPYSLGKAAFLRGEGVDTEIESQSWTSVGCGG
jgi:DNA-binding NtrC family response regulator